jgi:hypothetical protein
VVLVVLLLRVLVASVCVVWPVAYPEEDAVEANFCLLGTGVAVRFSDFDRVVLSWSSVWRHCGLKSAGAGCSSSESSPSQ